MFIELHIVVCVVQVSQVDQVRKVPLDCQGLQENLVLTVGLVSNKIIQSATQTNPQI